MQYQEQKFNLPTLVGISPKQLEVHLKLYAGYVKNVNVLSATVDAYKNTEDEGGRYAVSEMKRRLGFEFDGMRMHEYYFTQWEGGASALSDSGALAQALTTQYGSIEKFLAEFKAVGMMRGIGWAVLYFDPKAGTFHTAWVGDHEFGQLSTLPIILTMDMWEHAYMVDYVPGDKGQYVEAFFQNLNWNVCEERFIQIQATK